MFVYVINFNIESQLCYVRYKNVHYANLYT